MTRILICEDQDSIRKMIEALVRARGHEVTSATTGAQALELAAQLPPALALVDLTIPGELDGFEVCRRLRDAQSTAHIPILIITALDDENSRRRARQVGASDYFTKPFSPIGLLGAIRRHLT